ncbi:HIT family protein [Streptomyces jumonjinensis]|uniref:HIT family protein n=1 Tax=Streptomyces jumonjinensis TaxID=1945 RepID=UPI0037A19C14
MTICPFCAIVAGDAPATVIREFAYDLAIIPLAPVVPGHIIVMPHQHIPDAAADPAIAGRTAACAAQLAADHPSANLVTSIGTAATQTIRHLHWHLVPREHGDGLKLPWP